MLKRMSFQRLHPKYYIAEHIFVAGKGRSGFVANSFCNALKSARQTAHVVGESTTPAIKSNDVFVIISGSGSTEHLRY